jgi:hypothetical protein
VLDTVITGFARIARLKSSASLWYAVDYCCVDVGCESMSDLLAMRWKVEGGDRLEVFSILGSICYHLSM